MRSFGWLFWRISYFIFKFFSKRPSIERWGLSYLHSNFAIDKLASSIARMLGNNGIACSVNVESIWIDNTPQAEVTTLNGTKINCELADLLFIVEQTYPGNTPPDEHGVLLQAKATDKHNELPPSYRGTSTLKERQLLEEMDTTKPLNLYKGTNINSSKPLGTYMLNSNPKGLSDYSRYLLMPKAWKWVDSDSFQYTPFQVGWPILPRPSTLLDNPKDIVQSVQEMVFSQTIGKQIISNTSQCDWSKMVNDLRGNYRGINMNGYNGQSRINRSPTKTSFMSGQNFSNMSYTDVPPNQPPGEETTESKDEMQPNISIIKVSIHHFNDFSKRAIMKNPSSFK